mmetsp:Transcript_10417/g.63636  ORF Transcript_10417/g.63636 Transcript_10417/m.63636 type:complete len:274 (+) Transcript_10417:1540-2361(+)
MSHWRCSRVIISQQGHHFTHSLRIFDACISTILGSYGKVPSSYCQSSLCVLISYSFHQSLASSKKSQSCRWGICFGTSHFSQESHCLVYFTTSCMFHSSIKLLFFSCSRHHSSNSLLVFRLHVHKFQGCLLRAGAHVHAYHLLVLFTLGFGCPGLLRPHLIGIVCPLTRLNDFPRGPHVSVVPQMRRDNIQGDVFGMHSVLQVGLCCFSCVSFGFCHHSSFVGNVGWCKHCIHFFSGRPQSYRRPHIFISQSSGRHAQRHSILEELDSLLAAI